MIDQLRSEASSLICCYIFICCLPCDSIREGEGRGSPIKFQLLFSHGNARLKEIRASIMEEGNPSLTISKKAVGVARGMIPKIFLYDKISQLSLTLDLSIYPRIRRSFLAINLVVLASFISTGRARDKSAKNC
jgi:hypothetical protein